MTTPRAASLLMLRAVPRQVRCARSGCLLMTRAARTGRCAAVRWAAERVRGQWGGTRLRRAPAAAPRPVRACTGPGVGMNSAQRLGASLAAAAAAELRSAAARAALALGVTAPDARPVCPCRRVSEVDHLCALRKVRYTAAQSARLGATPTSAPRDKTGRVVRRAAATRVPLRAPPAVLLRWTTPGSCWVGLAPRLPL
jgi:hypothetical protein